MLLAKVREVGRELNVAGVEQRANGLDAGHARDAAQHQRNLGGRFATNASYASRKSACVMSDAWICASASSAAPRSMCASRLSASFVIWCANEGPAASLSA